jgi:putative toxin-antitoxin system antitoxin component (TIGR02293 family)
MKSSTIRKRATAQRTRKGTADPKQIQYAMTESGMAPLANETVAIFVAKPADALSAALGIVFADRGAAIKHVKEGLAFTVFERLSKALEVPAARLASLAGIAPRTLDRRKKDGRLQTAESERVLRLVSLFDKAVSVLGDVDTARGWFKQPLHALGGRSPMEYADTEIGAREVEDLLGRLEHGVVS